MQANAVNAIELNRYSVLRISGADRHDFLQGQLTQDIATLSPQHSALTGWTNAKGRLLATGQLMDWKQAIYLPMPRDIADEVARRLSMFILRADVTIDLPALRLLGLVGPPDDPVHIDGLELPPEPGACRSNDTMCVARFIGDSSRARIIATPDAARAVMPGAETGQSDTNDWALGNIRAGFPEIQASTSEMFTPQMLNLDLLGGISFTKGCYVGQEIVARTQNLGRIKRRMYRFRSESEHQFEPGQLMHGPDNATGKIVSCARDGETTEMLAVIAIKTSDGEWFADEARTVPLKPMPLPYPIPEADS